MSEDRELLLAQIEKHEPWFYDFDIGGNHVIKSKLPVNIRGIHETRLTMLLEAVTGHFGDRLSSVDCLDIGCHEGYFSLEIADRVRSVKGVDVRSESLEKAELVRKLKDAKNVSFSRGDCFKLDEAVQDKFDLTLFLGVLYHLDNPLGALREVSRVTKELCVIETQVVDELPGKTEWGSKDWQRDYKGTFALIDERPEFDSGNAEAGSFGLSLCPSLGALRVMLEAVGFRQITVVNAPVGGYEQHVRGKRVVVSAAK